LEEERNRFLLGVVDRYWAAAFALLLPLPPVQGILVCHLSLARCALSLSSSASEGWDAMKIGSGGCDVEVSEFPSHSTYFLLRLDSV